MLARSTQTACCMRIWPVCSGVGRAGMKMRPKRPKRAVQRMLAERKIKSNQHSRKEGQTREVQSRRAQRKTYNITQSHANSTWLGTQTSAAYMRHVVADRPATTSA